jgi:threonine dehydratase
VPAIVSGTAFTSVKRRRGNVRAGSVSDAVADASGSDELAAKITTMQFTLETPFIRLANLFPDHAVFAKCEFLAPSGCFKIRGAVHLLEHLDREGRRCELIVPSAGNTAVGAAVAAKAFGYNMTGIVPKTIARAKDEKLRGLGINLVTIDGGGSELLRAATELAKERGGYFVHPHLDPLWTDGYRSIAAEILQAIPDCRSIVVPVGGGGLLMGLLAHIREHGSAVRLFGVEPYSYPKYAPFTHARTDTIADGLKLEKPHPSVQQAIAEAGIPISLVQEAEIRAAMRDLYQKHALVIEPSSAVPLAFARTHAAQMPEPICVVLTGENIAREDYQRLIANTLN